MATMRHGRGDSTTETLVANAAGSSATRYVTGPAFDANKYGGKVQGRYVLETGTTYRWVEDFQINAGATVSKAFTCDNL